MSDSTPMDQFDEDEVTALPPLPILKRVEPKPAKATREARVAGKKTKLQTRATPPATSPPSASEHWLNSQVSGFQSPLSASSSATSHSLLHHAVAEQHGGGPPPATAVPPPPDIEGQVAELQAQIAALKALVERRESRDENQESGLPPSPPLMSPFGLPTAGYPASPAGTCSAFQSQVSASSPATRHQPPATDSPVSPAPSDLAAQVTTLSEQISSLRSQFSTLDSRPSTQSPVSGLQPPVSGFQPPVSAFQSQVSASSPATRHQPPATDSPISSLKSQVSSSIAVYELKETRPVGYQSQGNSTSFSDEDQDGFFSGLLDRFRIQWLMGDWESLSKLDLEQISSHPDRAKLALFGSVGLIQTGRTFDALKYLEFAKSQGCSSKLIKTILLSGIHTSMYSANLLNGHENKAVRHKSELDRFGLPNSMPKSLHLLNREQSCAFPALRQSLPEISPRIKGLAEQVANDPNPSEKSTQLLKAEEFSAREKFLFLCQLSKEFQKRGNKMVAASYLEEASHVLPPNQSADHLWFIVKRLLELGMLDDAFAKRLMIPETHHVLNSEETMSLQKAGKNLLEKIYDFKGHGHELLISISQKYAGRLRSECAGRKPVLIEIGTTRESVSGQGSTRRLAELCHREKFHFITVDMDRACTEMAREMFIENGFSFEAIHSKGEDFLASYSGPIDGIFLDAYDFDHGMHTELRQSRYEKFLGSRISETDCHQMHLDCTLEIIKKANPWTLVCLDDTWLHLGRWTAKGTLAVPCLFENGYQLLDVRNKAVLMGAGYWSAQVPAGKPY